MSQPNIGGLKPTPRSRKDYSLTKTFGAPKLNLPETYDVEAEKGDVNGPREQEENFCTAYTISEIGADEHGVQMDPHAQACFISMLAGSPILYGANMRDAIRSGRTFGFLPVANCPFHDRPIDRLQVTNFDKWPAGVLDQAQKWAMPAFFKVDGPYDPFDNHRAQLVQHAPDNGIALGVPWNEGFNKTKRDGMVRTNTNPASGTYFWHAITLKGFTTKGGKEVVKIRSWNVDEGAHTYFYFDRPTFNAMMRTDGAISFMYRDLPDDPTFTDKRFDLLGVLRDALSRFLLRLRYGV